METLIPFLKHGSVVDLLVIVLVTLITVILIPIGIWIAIAARSRLPLVYFLLLAMAPLLLALFGTYLRFRDIERVLSEFPDAGKEVMMAAREEALITTYIGAVGSVILWLVGLSGLLFKKENRV